MSCIRQAVTKIDETSAKALASEVLIVFASVAALDICCIYFITQYCFSSFEHLIDANRHNASLRVFHAPVKLTSPARHIVIDDFVIVAIRKPDSWQLTRSEYSNAG